MRKNPFIKQLLLIAVFLYTLAPALVMAQAASSNGQFIQICTAYGIQSVLLDENGVPVENDKAADTVSDHCPFCMVRAAAFIPPQTVSVPAPSDSQLHSYFIFDEVNFFTNAAVTPHNPRAPPAFS